jgi:ATP-binding cassette subfamily C protein CydD
VQFHAAAEGVAATDDVFDVLDAVRGRAAAERLVPRERDATPAPGSDPALVLEGIRVRRGERRLPPVDVSAARGTVTLIEGPSGVGKSSLFAALRGAAVFEGAATWQGVDVRDLAAADWLAWAGQRPGLLAGTIAENVSLGDPAPDDATVRQALDLACAELLDPQQELGVQGAGLSGGQSQRVAVARAFYRHLRGNAPVIALDEPSSALDPQTERRLWRSIRHLADQGATVLLISHRASAREIADVVVQLEASEVLA